jgi:hypothetical protein
MKTENNICMFIKLTVLLMIILFAGSYSGIAQTRNIVPLSQASFSPSPEFHVMVNGKNVLVYSSPLPAAFCIFDMEKPVDIFIKSLTRDVKWVDVRPLSAGIKPLISSDSSITFRINKTGQYSIELNGIIKIPLFLFANAPETNKPDRADKNVLYFEAGKIHYPGTMYLKNNQQIYIEGGAIVVGNVRAGNVSHIKIRGHGILDGSYSRYFMDSCARANNTNGNGNVIIKSADVNGLISISECNDIMIEGLTIYNSKTWDVVPVLCKNVNISNIKIVSDNDGDDGIDIVSSKNVIVVNSFIHTKDDCIAIKSFAKPKPPAGQTPAGQVRTEQQSFGQLASGPFYGVDSVTVKNCVFWNALWGNGIEIGFELSGDVTNIRFTDNDIIHVEGGAAFSIHNARRGTVSNILVDDLRVEYADQKLFDLAIFRSVYSEDGTRDEEEIKRLYLNGVWDNVLRITEEEKESHEKFRGHIRDFTLKNVSVTDGPFPFSVFYGSDKNHLIENITIENLTIHGRNIKEIANAKLYLENTKNIIIK